MTGGSPQAPSAKAMVPPEKPAGTQGGFLFQATQHRATLYFHTWVRLSPDPLKPQVGESQVGE